MCYQCNRKEYLKQIKKDNPEHYLLHYLIYLQKAKEDFPERGGTCEKIGVYTT